MNIISYHLSIANTSFYSRIRSTPACFSLICKKKMNLILTPSWLFPQVGRPGNELSTRLKRKFLWLGSLPLAGWAWAGCQPSGCSGSSGSRPTRCQCRRTPPPLHRLKTFFKTFFTSSPLWQSTKRFCPAIEFLWLSLWFWSKTEAISSPFFLIESRAFLLSWVAMWRRKR